MYRFFNSSLNRKKRGIKVQKLRLAVKDKSNFKSGSIQIHKS